MDISKILNNKELQDIPILYILRVIHIIQKEQINDQSCAVCEKLYNNNKSVKE